MVSPFKVAKRAETPRRLYQHLFDMAKKRLDRGAEQQHNASEIVRWADCPYHDKFIDWLQSEVDRPVKISGGPELIAATARSNTFKELLQHLNRLERDARRVLED